MTALWCRQRFGCLSPPLEEKAVMRRFLVESLFTFVVLAMLAPPVFAQAPTPKVTITGLFDQITSGGRNFYDGNLTRSSDREWYARTRFRPDFEFAVGRVKAVLGLEIDLQYGQAGANDGGFPGNNSGTNSGCKVNSNGCLDLNTDVGGMIEIKWIYTEFPLTGKDSLLPFIPVETIARAGGQPFAGLANYKIVYANGDFAGVSAVTTFAPNIKTNLAYVMIEDQLAGANRGIGALKTTRGEDYAVIVSPEITPFKGLDLKPLFSWFHADGVTASGSRHHVVDIHFAGPANTRPTLKKRSAAVLPRATRRTTRIATRSVWTRAGARAPSASIPRSTTSGASGTTGRSSRTARSRRSRPT